MKKVKNFCTYLVLIALGAIVLFSMLSCEQPTPATPIAASTRPYPTPELIRPSDGASISGKQITEFAWQWHGKLEEREMFDLRMWQSGESPATIAIPTTSDFFLDAPLNDFGEYLWQVAIVRTDENGDPLTLSESQVWSFVWSESAPIPTDTPLPPTDTPMPTDTPLLPTDTPILTDTPLPPTDTPVSTDTPAIAPTLTRTPTMAPTCTSTPTPISSLLPAPILQGPPEGDDFCPGESLWLTWAWNAKPFSPGEYYGVKVWKDEPQYYDWDRHWEADPNKQLFEVKLWPDTSDISPKKKYYQGPGRYLWNIVMLRDTGQTVTDKYGTDRIGEEVSKVSETRSFIVRTNDDPACWP